MPRAQRDCLGPAAQRHGDFPRTARLRRPQLPGDELDLEGRDRLAVLKVVADPGGDFDHALTRAGRSHPDLDRGSEADSGAHSLPGADADPSFRSESDLPGEVGLRHDRGDLELEELAPFGLRPGGPMTVNGARCVYAKTFAEVQPGEPLVYEDAYRTLALAVNRGSAAELLDLAIDDEVRIRPAP